MSSSVHLAAGATPSTTSVDRISLAWYHRAWTPGAPLLGPRRVVLDEIFPGPRREHRLMQGDALRVCGRLQDEGMAGKVKLVYVDPPYFSQSDYVHEARLDGKKDGRVKRSLAYEDNWTHAIGNIAGYLEMLAPRLEAASRLLAPDGTIWVHLDWRASYLARCILDEVMGRDAFLNEIVWKRAPNLGRQAQSFQFGRTLDTLIVYGGPKARLQPPTRLEVIDPKAIRWDEEKRPFTAAPRGDYTDDSIERLEREGRVHRSKTGKVYIKYFLVKNEHGEWCRERRVDTLWTDIAPIRHSKNDERTGYPTQKPVALLERVLLSASVPGDLVLDVFGGSGTTAVAAEKLGRVAVVGDEQSLAISMMRSRLLREGAAFRMERLDPPDTKRPAPEVECAFEARSTFVRLLAPKEPMAWAVQVQKGEVGPLFAQDVQFETVWHSERGARTSPTPVDLDAKIRKASRVRVLVFEDDGTVLEKIVDDARAKPESLVRKGKSH